MEFVAKAEPSSSSSYRERIHVAIIGGGLSGLATALALQKIGIKCTVFEKDSCFSDRMQGYGLTLTNNTKGPLNALGLLDECIERDCPSNAHWVFNPSGEILGYFGRCFDIDDDMEKVSLEKNKEKGSNRGNLRIPRQDLRQMLIDRLKPDTIVWGYKLTGYSETNEKVQLQFSNEESITCDLLVGTDGIRSIVRQQRDKSEREYETQLEYIGVSVIIGISTAQHPLINQKGFYILDGRHRLFTMPFQQSNDGNTTHTMWQLSFSGVTEKETLDLKAAGCLAVVQEALKRTDGWFSPVHELINNTPLQEIWCTPLYDRLSCPLQQRNKQNESRVTVLGDACHPMSMFKGQGANMALEDGPLLASWLQRPGLDSKNILTRIRCFEREMLSRTLPKVSASREAANTLHNQDILQDSELVQGIFTKYDTNLLAALKTRGVKAQLGDQLEQRAIEVYRSLLHEIKDSTYL